MQRKVNEQAVGRGRGTPAALGGVAFRLQPVIRSHPEASSSSAPPAPGVITRRAPGARRSNREATESRAFAGMAAMAAFPRGAPVVWIGECSALCRHGRHASRRQPLRRRDHKSSARRCAISRAEPRGDGVRGRGPSSRRSAAASAHRAQGPWPAGGGPIRRAVSHEPQRQARGDQSGCAKARTSGVRFGQTVSGTRLPGMTQRSRVTS